MKEKNGEHPYGDTVQLLLLVVFLAVWIYDSFFWHRSTFLSGSVPITLRLIVSAVVIGTAFYFFKSSHFIAHGDRRPGGVVASGVFMYVRHPLYLGAILLYMGLVISTLSLFCGVLFVVIFTFYNYIAGYEEKLLEKKFGEAYVEYRRRTGKWVPRIGGSG